MYVYIKSEAQLWTAGFYKPDGTWEAESDHESTEKAAERVHYLNGAQVRCPCGAPDVPTGHACWA